MSSGVPDECNVTMLFGKISLSEPAIIWAETINNLFYKREDTFQWVKEAGYDINDAANKLQKLYLICVLDKIG